ncbi:MAG: hypothetical protein ACK5NE_06825 [Brachymonas sp.]
MALNVFDRQKEKVAKSWLLMLGNIHPLLCNRCRMLTGAGGALSQPSGSFCVGIHPENNAIAFWLTDCLRNLCRGL